VLGLKGSKLDSVVNSAVQSIRYYVHRLTAKVRVGVSNSTYFNFNFSQKVLTFPSQWHYTVGLTHTERERDSWLVSLPLTKKINHL